MRSRLAMTIAAALLSLVFLPGAVAAAQPAHAVTTTTISPSDTASGSTPSTPAPSTTPGKSNTTKRTGSGVIIGILILGGAVFLIRRLTGVRPARWRRPPPGQQAPPEE